MPHALVVALELAGAVCILAGFTLSQIGLLDQHSVVYLILNLVGSSVRAMIAFVDQRWGFLLLEASGRSSHWNLARPTASASSWTSR